MIFGPINPGTWQQFLSRHKHLPLQEAANQYMQQLAIFEHYQFNQLNMININANNSNTAGGKPEPSPYLFLDSFLVMVESNFSFNPGFEDYSVSSYKSANTGSNGGIIHFIDPTENSIKTSWTASAGLLPSGEAGFDFLNPNEVIINGSDIIVSYNYGSGNTRYLKLEDCKIEKSTNQLITSSYEYLAPDWGADAHGTTKDSTYFYTSFRDGENKIAKINMTDFSDYDLITLNYTNISGGSAPKGEEIQYYDGYLYVPVLTTVSSSTAAGIAKLDVNNTDSPLELVWHDDTDFISNNTGVTPSNIQLEFFIHEEYLYVSPFTFADDYQLLGGKYIGFPKENAQYFLYKVNLNNPSQEERISLSQNVSPIHEILVTGNNLIFTENFAPAISKVDITNFSGGVTSRVNLTESDDYTDDDRLEGFTDDATIKNGKIYLLDEYNPSKVLVIDVEDFSNVEILQKDEINYETEAALFGITHKDAVI
jgi:hypothetical protein